MKRILCLLFVTFFLQANDSILVEKQKYINGILKHPKKSKSVPYVRSALCVSCNDCDYIPKVADAGKIIFHKNKKCQVMHNGIKILQGCYCEGPSCPWMTEIIYNLKGHHEPQEEKVFYEVLKHIPENGKMLELGSYWAYFSLWFHSEIPNATNYMIEPSPRQINIGKENFALNDFKGHFDIAFIGRKIDLPKDGRSAPQLSVDEYVKRKKIDFLDIIHSDIQGAEHEMLKGAENTIRSKKVGYFFISTHAEHVHKNCVKFLKNKNFIIVAEHTPKESFSIDGLIVARAKYYPGINHVEVSKNKKNINWRSL
jgi:hypothetical protein